MSTSTTDQHSSGRCDRSDATRAGEPCDGEPSYVRSIVDTVREPLVVLDALLRVRSANRAFYRTFRVSPQETEGRLLYDLGNRQWDVPRLRALLEEILPQKASFDDFELEHDFPGIGRKVMLLNARKLRHEGAEVILLAIEDVTERQRAEAERHALETRFASLAKIIKDRPVFTLDTEGRVTRWNIAAEHVLGYTEAEALGRHFSFIFTAEDRQQGLPETELREAEEDGRAEDERWHVRKDGERLWALGILSALRDADGRLTGYSKILRDMTAWKQAEQELRASEERLRRVLDIDGVGVLIFDGSGALVDANDAFLRMTGYGREKVEARALTWRDMTPPEHVAESERQMRRLSETGRIGPYEKAYFRKDGSRSWMLFAGASLGDGTVVEYCVDVDDRKRAEEALRRSEERFRALVQASSDVVYRMSPDWTEMHQLLGRDFIADTDAPSRGWLQKYIHPDDQAQVMAVINDAIRARSVFELEHRVVRVDGSLGWTFSRAIPMLDASGAIVEWLGMASDVTERRRAEEALRKSEAKYRSLFESIDEGFCIIEVIFDARDKPVDYRFLEVNPAFERHTGLVNARGKRMRELVPQHEEYWFEIYGRIALTGEATRFQNRAAQLRRWYDVHAWRYGRSQDRNVAVLFDDVTSRKEAEEALQDANRRKDAFLATLAHELRNPLMPIRTGLDLLQALRNDPAACEEPLRIMDRQLDHLVRLVDDLLDVSRISRGKIRLHKEQLDLAEIVDAALDMCRSALSQGERRVTVSVPPEPLPVEGDRVRLVQIVANLLSNAVKFTDTGGRIELCVMPRGDCVEIRVQDDGRGISRERLDEIWDMFAQDEPGSGEGLGIGLSIVQSLVAMHGGAVSAASEGPGCGATFTVSLPLCRDAPAQQPMPREPVEDRSLPRRRVLVVDDNRDIAESLRQLLTLLNAEVRVAHDGTEALRICQDWQPTHVLMDLGMPGMDGYEAARRLRAEHPDHAFRLIAISGWGQDDDRQRTRESGFDEHLGKPVGVAALKAVLSG